MASATTPVRINFTPTANGWPLAPPMPDPWDSFTQMDWKVRRQVTANVSPYTGQTQVYEWVGGDGWSVTCTTKPLTHEELRAWRAWLWIVTGGVNAFLLGDPTRRKVSGLSAGATAQERAARSTVHTALTVNPTANPMDTQIGISGFLPNQAHALSPGDLISANSRLYEVLIAVNADALGSAYAAVRPSVREVLGVGTPVQTHDAQGLFRLAKTETAISVDGSGLTKISFECVEAR